MTAAGFPGGFQQWWSKLESKHGQAPAYITWSCPTFTQTQGISFTFMTELHQLENTLNSEMQKKAKENRVTNPNKIFDDIAKPRASPIQLLEEPITTEIVAVHRDRSTVEINQANAFDTSQEVQHKDEIVLFSTQRTPTEYEANEIEKFEVGDNITQNRKYGSVEDISTNLEKNGGRDGISMPKHQKLSGNQFVNSFVWPNPTFLHKNTSQSHWSSGSIR